MALILAFSVLFGFDIDTDSDLDSTTGSSRKTDLGPIKSFLTFISLGSFAARAIVIYTNWSSSSALLLGVLVGIGGIILLSSVLKMLLRQQESKA